MEHRIRSPILSTTRYTDSMPSFAPKMQIEIKEMLAAWHRNNEILAR
jgi:hypothetical protein